MLSKTKILESIVYVIFQLILFWGREIVQGGGEILPKFPSNVSAKFWVNFWSSKYYQNHNTSYVTLLKIVMKM